MMNKSLAVVALLAAALGAQAQTKEELAKRVIELQRPVYENIGRTAAALPANQLMRALAQSVRRVPADQRETVGKQLEVDVRQFHAEVDALLRERAVALAPATLQPLLLERFNEAELKQLITWLESPLARKFHEIGPQLTTALSRKLMTDARGDIEPKLKALQATFNKRLAAAASAPQPASAPSK
jgi:hypothetical protein